MKRISIRYFAMFSMIVTVMSFAVFTGTAWAGEDFTVAISSITTAATDAEDPGSCPAAMLLEDDPESLDLLRQYRDEQLMQSQTGRAIVTAYYTVGPAMCALMESNPGMEEIGGVIIDQAVLLVGSEGLSDYLDCIGDVLGEISDCSGFDFGCVVDVLAKVFDCF